MAITDHNNIQKIPLLADTLVKTSIVEFIQNNIFRTLTWTFFEIINYQTTYVK